MQSPPRHSQGWWHGEAVTEGPLHQLRWSPCLEIEGRRFQDD
jgi:hypothetical protein